MNGETQRTRQSETRGDSLSLSPFPCLRVC